MPSNERKKKRKRKATMAKPYCFYCLRTFDDEKVLLEHQRAKHFKCPQCPRKLASFPGLATHLQLVHGFPKPIAVPAAVEAREKDVSLVISGMEGFIASEDPLNPNFSPEERAAIAEKRREIEQRVREIEAGMVPSSSSSSSSASTGQSFGGDGVAAVGKGGYSFPAAVPGILPGYAFVPPVYGASSGSGRVPPGAPGTVYPQQQQQQHPFLQASQHPFLQAQQQRWQSEQHQPQQQLPQKQQQTRAQHLQLQQQQQQQHQQQPSLQQQPLQGENMNMVFQVAPKASENEDFSVEERRAALYRTKLQQRKK